MRNEHTQTLQRRLTAAETTTSAALPRLDVREAKDRFLVEVEVPGAGKEDVDLRVEKGILEVVARVPDTAGSPERYHVREFASRDFVRQLRLDETIDTERITAEVARGLLTIHLPKVAAATPRRIEVR
ncbi:MAG TPA: Hsp20/alpha crystallin family protein [Vicinamibacteria bacterium]|jgi:HSP20 family protein